MDGWTDRRFDWIAKREGKAGVAICWGKLETNYSQLFITIYLFGVDS
jgi:hypothetical protein